MCVCYCKRFEQSRNENASKDECKRIITSKRIFFKSYKSYTVLLAKTTLTFSLNQLRVNTVKILYRNNSNYILTILYSYESTIIHNFIFRNKIQLRLFTEYRCIGIHKSTVYYTTTRNSWKICQWIKLIFI